MKKRILAMILALLCVVMCLTGCGAGKSNETTAPEDDAAADGAETTADAAETGETEDEPTAEAAEKITVVTWEENSTPYFPALLEAFKADTGIEVEVVNFDGGEYDEKLSVTLAAQPDYDVIFFKNPQTLQSAVEKNQVLPMNDYLTNTELDLSTFSGLFEALTAPDGNTYGAPYRKDFQVLYYNKDMFDAAGVDYPADGMTLEDFRALCQQIASGEGNDRIYACTELGFGDYLDMAVRAGEFNRNDPATYEAVLPYYEVLLAMQKDDATIPDYAETKATQNLMRFVNGESAMMMVGTWMTGHMLPDGAFPVEFAWDVRCMPSLNGVGNTAGEGSVTPVAIGANASNPDGAWKFIEYAVGEKGASILAEHATVPACTSDAVIEVIQSVEGIPEDYGDYISLDTYYMAYEMAPKSGETTQLVNQTYDLIMTYTETPEEATAELKADAEALLDS